MTYKGIAVKLFDPLLGERDYSAPVKGETAHVVEANPYLSPFSKKPMTQIYVGEKNGPRIPVLCDFENRVVLPMPVK